jgi:hypothetical protein
MTAPVYRWVPGMRATLDVGDAGLVLLVDDDGEILVDWDGFGAALCKAALASPDLDHGPTRGALLDQVRELSGEPRASTSIVLHNGEGRMSWLVAGPCTYTVGLPMFAPDPESKPPTVYGEGATEGAAIMDALTRLAAKPVEVKPAESMRPALVVGFNRIRALFDLGKGVDGELTRENVNRYIDETVEAVRTAARNADRVEAIERRRADEMRSVLERLGSLRRQLDAAQAERGEDVPGEGDHLDVHHGVVAPEDLDADLVELAVATALGLLVTEVRTGVPRLERKCRPVLDEGAAHARRLLGTECDMAPALVDEVVHLLGDDVGGLADP